MNIRVGPRLRLDCVRSSQRWPSTMPIRFKVIAVVACLWLNGCAAEDTVIAASGVDVSKSSDMSHIVYYYTGDVIHPGSLGSQAYELWKAGDYKSRLRLPPFPNHTQTIVIYNEGDGWVLNLPTQEALHSVDSPPLPVRSPIFQVRGFDPGVMQLEFGSEAPFFATHRADEGQSSYESTNEVQEVQVGNTLLTLRIDSHGKPLEIEAKAPGAVATVHYQTYEANMAIAPGIFLPPEGARIKEANRKYILLQAQPVAPADRPAPAAPGDH